MSQDAVQRAHDRCPVRAETLILTSTPGAEQRLSRTRDISPSGVFVETERPVRVGEELKLLISDQRKAVVLRVSAEVVHVHDGIGFGAKFIMRSRAGDESVRSFVARLTDRN